MPGMNHGQMPTSTQGTPTTPDMEETHQHRHAGPATQPAASAALYTCKMHPQVVSNHPGNCPICGMKLVKKAQQGVNP